MKASLLFLSLLLVIGSLSAQQAYENNLFTETQKLQVFNTEQQLVEYLKTEKPSTYRYFERLDFSGKKRVLEQHLENADLDITEVVIKVYRKHSRG